VRQARLGENTSSRHCSHMQVRKQSKATSSSASYKHKHQPGILSMKQSKTSKTLQKRENPSFPYL